MRSSNVIEPSTKHERVLHLLSSLRIYEERRLGLDASPEIVYYVEREILEQVLFYFNRIFFGE